MLTFPNAKINLGLNVVEKRPDGYHNIETVFYPIPLCDSLEIILSSNKEKKASLSTYGIDVKAEEKNNLVIKSYNLLDEIADLPAVDIHLYKKIPFGAGLGGGSSDAAFTLKMLNSFVQQKLSEEELIGLSSKLGADCAFFIRNVPVYATGIGDVFESIRFSLKGYHLILIKPDIFVSTPEAYQSIVPQKTTVSLKEIIHYPIPEWKKYMVNDFERPVFKKYPEIEQIKNKLYDIGALYVSMSGSGSSVFGIFETVPDDFASLFNTHFCWNGTFDS